jgi:butyrate kinase
MQYRILAINLGSTSSKIAVYYNLNEQFKTTIIHTKSELSQFYSIWEQKDFRKEKIISTLEEKNAKLETFDIIACRGGCLKPIPGGVYLVDEGMLEDLRSEKFGSHPSNVGSFIAYELGKSLGIKVVTADPPTIDEFCKYARYSGIKEISRVSSFHALNQKRTAKKIAKKFSKEYEDLNLIVVHLGGGISVAAHEKGRVIDVNNALDGDGPFACERSGTLPVGDLIKMCYSGKYTEEEMIKKIKGNGGLMSYLKTNSGLEVEDRIKNGDSYAKEIFETMAYQVSKEIGANVAVLKGKVDAIVLTGSLAHSQNLVNWIQERTNFIAPIYLSPGENEMLSLAENAYYYITGEEKAKVYKDTESEGVYIYA